MANKSNTVGTIFASVFITLILSGTGMYFGLPLVYPNLANNDSDIVTQDDLDDYVLKNETLNNEVVVQSKYHENNSTEVIWDYDLTPSVMPGTELNITTQGNTKLSVSFDAQFELTLVNAFDGGAFYDIKLQIEGVKQETFKILEYHGEPIVGQTENSIYVQISFETGILPAGTYNISVLWCSVLNTAQLSRLSVGIYLGDNSFRTISAQEILV